jgi:hypothetical protein
MFLLNSAAHEQWFKRKPPVRAWHQSSGGLSFISQRLAFQNSRLLDDARVLLQ